MKKGWCPLCGVSLLFVFLKNDYNKQLKQKQKQKQEQKQERKTMGSNHSRKHLEPKWEKYTDNEPIDLERSATAITVKKRVGEDGRVEVKARFPMGPSPLYFGPPFTFGSPGMLWSFKMKRNSCWICGLVPIGKKDYRGPLDPGKLICLEEEKEAFVVTPNYSSVSGTRHQVSIEKEMDIYGKEIEVRVLGKQKEVILTAKKGEQVETAVFDVSGSKWVNGFSFCVAGFYTAELTLKQTMGSSVKRAKRS